MGNQPTQQSGRTTLTVKRQRTEHKRRLPELPIDALLNAATWLDLESIVVAQRVSRLLNQVLKGAEFRTEFLQAKLHTPFMLSYLWNTASLFRGMAETKNIITVPWMDVDMTRVPLPVQFGNWWNLSQAGVRVTHIRSSSTRVTRGSSSEWRGWWQGNQEGLRAVESLQVPLHEVGWAHAFSSVAQSGLSRLHTITNVGVHDAKWSPEMKSLLELPSLRALRLSYKQYSQDVSTPALGVMQWAQDAEQLVDMLTVPTRDTTPQSAIQDLALIAHVQSFYEPQARLAGVLEPGTFHLVNSSIDRLLRDLRMPQGGAGLRLTLEIQSRSSVFTTMPRFPQWARPLPRLLQAAVQAGPWTSQSHPLSRQHVTMSELWLHPIEAYMEYVEFERDRTEPSLHWHIMEQENPEIRAIPQQLVLADPEGFYHHGQFNQLPEDLLPAIALVDFVNYEPERDDQVPTFEYQDRWNTALLRLASTLGGGSYQLQLEHLRVNLVPSGGVQFVQRLLHSPDSSSAGFAVLESLDLCCNHWSTPDMFQPLQEAFTLNRLARLRELSIRSILPLSPPCFMALVESLPKRAQLHRLRILSSLPSPLPYPSLAWSILAERTAVELRSLTITDVKASFGRRASEHRQHVFVRSHVLVEDPSDYDTILTPGAYDRLLQEHTGSARPFLLFVHNEDHKQTANVLHQCAEREWPHLQDVDIVGLWSLPHTQVSAWLSSRTAPRLQSLRLRLGIDEPALWQGGATQVLAPIVGAAPLMAKRREQRPETLTKPTSTSTTTTPEPPWPNELTRVHLTLEHAGQYLWFRSNGRIGVQPVHDAAVLHHLLNFDVEQAEVASQTWERDAGLPPLKILRGASADQLKRSWKQWQEHLTRAVTKGHLDAKVLSTFTPTDAVPLITLPPVELPSVPESGEIVLSPMDIDWIHLQHQERKEIKRIVIPQRVPTPVTSASAAAAAAPSAQPTRRILGQLNQGEAKESRDGDEDPSWQPINELAAEQVKRMLTQCQAPGTNAIGEVHQVTISGSSRQRWWLQQWRNITIVRDDMSCGGTKARLVEAIVHQVLPPGVRDIVYVASEFGAAQAAVMAGLQSSRLVDTYHVHVFSSGQSAESAADNAGRQFAKALGGIQLYIYNTPQEAQSAAEQLIQRLGREQAMLLPSGFDLPTLVSHLGSAVYVLWHTEWRTQQGVVAFDEMWATCGSGMLSRSLFAANAMAKQQLARKQVAFAVYGGSSCRDLPAGIEIVTTDQPISERVTPEQAPPFPSWPWMDAKMWWPLVQRALQNPDKRFLAWNVA